MDFVVAGYPNVENKLSEEVSMLKVAALYGDKITLISPMYQIYNAMTIDNINKNKFEVKVIDSLLTIYPLCEMADPSIGKEKDSLLEIRSIFKSKIYKDYSVIEKYKIKQFLAKTYKELMGKVENILGKEEVYSIKELKKANRLVVKDFKYNIADIDNYIIEYLMSANESIKNFYPLFDKKLGELLSTYRNEKFDGFSEVEELNFKTGGVSKDFITKLPAFDTASMDEILDIRKELEKPLIRFRSSVLEYSDSVKVLPWDKDFEMNCRNLYIQFVAPEILNIEEAIEDNKVFKNLLSSFTSKEDLAVHFGSFIISFLSFLNVGTDKESLKKIIVSAGTFATTEGINSVIKTKNNNKEIKRNDLYFLYATNEKLKNKRK